MKIYFYIVLAIVIMICRPALADVIGCDENGIVCLDDNLDLFRKEFRTLDLDFDGQYELYYFDINGRLVTNQYINDSYFNKKGQQILNGEKSIVPMEPQSVNVYQIDNTDYYYINKVKLGFNEDWEVQGDDNGREMARVNIYIPEIVGEDKNLTDKLNKKLGSQGLELLVLYAREEVFKRRTSKFTISINKFVKEDVQKLNFVPMLGEGFYFNFDVTINYSGRREISKNLGLEVLDDGCRITNFDLQHLNNATYKNEEYVKKESDGTYSERYSDYVEGIINECSEAFSDYVDGYNSYILEYDVNVIGVRKVINAINKYIKNIDNVYNNYDKIAREDYRNKKIDLETYDYISDRLHLLREKFKNILSHNLQFTIDDLYKKYETHIVATQPMIKE